MSGEVVGCVGARGKAWEVAEVETSVLVELVGIRAVVQSMQRRCRQTIAPTLPFRFAAPPDHIAPSTHAFRDNAVLFGERREDDWNIDSLCLIELGACSTRNAPCVVEGVQTVR